MTSLFGSIARSVAAGVAGTALMTGYQRAVRKGRGERLDVPVPRTWADAPPPAQVVKRAAEALGHGRDVTKKHVPVLTNVVHWAYGVTLGVAYGVAARSLRPDPLAGGAAFGATVWAVGYGELVPLGIYEPPWRYPLPELALDLSYHLVYGMGVAAAYAALDR